MSAKKDIKQLALEDVNRESIIRLVQRVELILGNMDGEFTQLVINIANKISDLDTKIVLKKTLKNFLLNSITISTPS